MGTQTSKQLANLKVRHTALCNQIQLWREAQLVYMPCISSLTQTLTITAESSSIEPAESILLHLPSSLSQCFQQSSELSSIIEKECQLHVVQADDALVDI